MKNLFKLLVVSLLLVITACNKVAPPAAINPVPSKSQLAWNSLEYYGFLHFNMNTFTNMEWGTGGEKPEQFNPTALDVNQWVQVAKDAGMKGLIITAKHHDGFCLWPTKTTEHSVKNSPWKNGKGDLIKDLSEACKANGLKFGVYLSPWDRNAASYGSPEYVEEFHEQLRELLTNYGEIFEVWFDGANGGSGYYGGANETRKIDNKTYYEWDKTTAIVRELQPNAVIFSDGGPDIRWVGTEEGWAEETNWSIMRRDEIYPGWPRYVELRSGHEDGTHWLPAEVNTSIRPGWYYHPGEDHQVKSLSRLVKTYYESIGRNGTFLLNLPVDTRGLVHEKDVEALLALKKQIDADFETELAQGKKISATDVRGNSTAFAAENANDGIATTYWATNDSVTEGEITIDFDQPTAINRILLQEYIPLGQRVKSFEIHAEVAGKWKLITAQTTIGYKRILRFDTIEATKVKVTVTDAKGPLAISNIELYKAPNLVVEPIIERNADGQVGFRIPDKNVEVYYTLDGTEPSKASEKFTGYFPILKPATLKAVAINPENGETSAVVSKHVDVAKRDWKVIHISSGKDSLVHNLYDENPKTFWATDKNVTKPQEVVIDMSTTLLLKGFTYWPIQERYPFGIITSYEFSTSMDAKNWKIASQGEFANIVNSRLEQTIDFVPVKARYIKLKAVKVDGEDMQATIGELGVISIPNH